MMHCNMDGIEFKRFAIVISLEIISYLNVKRQNKIPQMIPIQSNRKMIMNVLLIFILIIQRHAITVPNKRNA